MFAACVLVFALAQLAPVVSGQLVSAHDGRSQGAGVPRKGYRTVFFFLLAPISDRL